MASQLPDGFDTGCLSAVDYTRRKTGLSYRPLINYVTFDGFHT
jgi:hypothetical protein